MKYLEDSFDAFFKSEAKVAVIKGNWGVGKTYFWDSYIDRRITDKDLSQIAYSYISLFGKTSLSDVKKSLFHSAKPISSDNDIESAFENQFTNTSGLLNRLPWIKDGIKKTHSKTPWLSWFTKNAQNIPVVGKFSNIISNLEYSMVNDYVICFDDLERKGNSLTVKEIMGLIDELAIRKNCKVVLIFNESSLDKDTDKKEFDSYREKVVDIELNHNPSCAENMEHVFSDDFNQISVISEAVNELGIKNIRVLKKIKWMIDDFSNKLETLPDSLQKEFSLHAVILCRGYFIRDNDLLFEDLKTQLNENSWMSFLSDKDKEKSPGEEKYSQIASNLQLSPSQFDDHIIHYLEHGFVNIEALSETISNLLEMADVEEVRLRLRGAWNIYSDSFQDNLDEFTSALNDILKEDISKLGLSDFSSAINILEEFGEDVSTFIRIYTEVHKESLKSINPRDSWDMDRIKNSSLQSKISEIHEETKNLNIDDVAEKIAVNRGWNTEDVGFLSSLSKDDFKCWMKGNPDRLTMKVRSGLLTFDKMGATNKSDQEKYEKISLNVLEALRDISSENTLNQKRVKNIYGVE
ncbi:conserved hypothetical protein [Oleispira antarctica RB-8]|uniref:KAP NTPase domain-containing protein n=1 Tax=Oleispira antarctica RB-8 TaxID=698738 RepID=R4YP65_OLEAN|nr:conserved hypothetical protein [Oleispira antarctica RB-8]